MLHQPNLNTLPRPFSREQSPFQEAEKDSKLLKNATNKLLIIVVNYKVYLKNIL